MNIEKSALISQPKMIYIEHESTSDQWHSILHSHTFVELFYVTKGSGCMKFSNIEVLDIKEDDLIIVNPNVFHTEFCRDNETIEYYVIAVEDINFDHGQSNSRYSIHNFKEYKHEVYTYLKTIHEESRNKELYHSDIENRLFEVLLMNILRRSNSKIEISQSSASYNKDCLFIENFINENSHLDISLDLLSEITYLDKYYLSHLFKDYSGMAPIEYLHQVRVEKAIKLLTTSDFTISYISSMLGFANAAYFSQFFKKKTKLAPSKYRKLYHISNQNNKNFTNL